MLLLFTVYFSIHLFDYMVITDVSVAVPERTVPEERESTGKFVFIWF